MRKFALAAGAVGLTLGAATPAMAVTYAFDAGLATPSAGFTTVANFNDGTLSGFTRNNASQVLVLSPPANSNGAPPANSSPSGTPYLSVLAGGSATYTFAAGGVTAFQFDWGSIDSYNTLTVNMLSGNGTMTNVVIPGSQLFTNTPANGNQVSPGTNGRFSVLGTSGERFTSITLTSSANSFEIDNLAVGSVPEPSVWGMLLLGFGMIGAGVRSRRRSTKVAFA